jgi:hypothetical protein
MLDYDFISKLNKNELVDLAINSKESFSASELDNIYFIQSQLPDSKIQNGVVETPTTFVKFMIKLALSRHDSDEGLIKWYDPCSGSGKFSIEILKYYLNKVDAEISESSLPFISFCELSKHGFYISLLNIKRVLEQFGLSLNKYLSEKKLCVYLGDALEISPEVKDVFSEQEVIADIVIGNPPYVRATRLTTTYKEKLKYYYPSTYNGSEDLYAYFYANAVSCSPNGSVVCFISPSSFLKKSTSKQLRNYLLKQSSPDCIIDFDENEIFENVSLHTIICCLKKAINIESVNFFHARNDEEIRKLFSNHYQFNSLPISNFGIEGWKLENHLLSNKDTIELKEAGFKVRSGVRPAIRNAYVYDFKELVGMPRDMVKPALKAKSIHKWCTKKASNDLLFITNDEHCLNEKAIDLLTDYKNKLEADKKHKESNSWMKLRSCSYYEEMKNAKIVFPDISSKPRFSLDETGSYILDGAFFVNTDDKCLLGILNSDVAWQYFKSSCSSIGNASHKGRLRLKKSHVEKFPLPKEYMHLNELKAKVERVVDEIFLHGESEELNAVLSSLVLEMYN